MVTGIGIGDFFTRRVDHATKTGHELPGPGIQTDMVIGQFQNPGRAVGMGEMPPDDAAGYGH